MTIQQPQIVVPKLLLTAAEAAATLSISERTLWSLAAAGDIRTLRLGRSVRYSTQALAEFIARNGGGAEPLSKRT
jgi:excisionase family DNA binding protein